MTDMTIRLYIDGKISGSQTLYQRVECPLQTI